MISGTKGSGLIVVLLISILSCGPDSKNEIKRTDLILSVDSFADTVFFSEITDIVSDSNHNLFFADEANSLVFRADSNLEFVSMLGSKGGGPMELEMPSLLFYQNEVIYVSDQYRGRLLGFSSEGSPVSSIPFDFFDEVNFSIDDNRIVYFSDIGDSPFLVSSLSSGEVISNFGERSGYDEYYPARHVFVEGDSVFSLHADNFPVIEVYSLNGELLMRRDFSDEPIFSRSVGLGRKVTEESSGTSAYVIMPDAQIFDGEMYALFTKLDDGETESNTIVKFSLVDEQAIQSVIRLKEDGWYEVFCVYDSGKIVAFESVNGTIDVFRIND